MNRHDMARAQHDLGRQLQEHHRIENLSRDEGKYHAIVLVLYVLKEDNYLPIQGKSKGLGPFPRWNCLTEKNNWWCRKQDPDLLKEHG